MTGICQPELAFPLGEPVTTATCVSSPDGPCPLEPPHILMMSPAVGSTVDPEAPIARVTPWEAAVACAVVTKLPPTRLPPLPGDSSSRVKPSL